MAIIFKSQVLNNNIVIIKDVKESSYSKYEDFIDHRNIVLSSGKVKGESENLQLKSFLESGFYTFIIFISDEL